MKARGMEGTLGLSAPPAALKGGRLTVLSQAVGAPVQPGRRSCLRFAAWESSLAVLCVHNTAELVSKYISICLGIDRMSSSIKLLLEPSRRF